MWLEVEVNNAVLADVIGGATIGYWGMAEFYDRKCLKMKLYEQVDLNKQSTILYLHPQHFQKGLSIMLEKYPHFFAQILTKNYDGTTGDVLIQLAAFGMVRYG